MEQDQLTESGETGVDVVIAGGGIMGCSAAFWLSRLSDRRLRICVVEQDPSHKQSSTALSVASIRQQFSKSINVKISRFGIEFIRNIQNHIGKLPGGNDLALRENGYLLLAGTNAGAQRLRQAHAMQQSLGAQTMLLEQNALKDRFPWLQVQDIALASFGQKDEGWFDNMGLLQMFRQAARQNGVAFLHDEIIGVRGSKGQVHDVKLAQNGALSVGTLINATGTNARTMLQYLGEEIPVEPRKRTVFQIDAPNAHFPDAPLMVCHTGFYLRPEGRHWLCATVPEDDCAADPHDFEPALHEFEDRIWPRLYARAPAFDAVKVLSAWAGHYAYNTLDQNAIVGRHPNWQNLYLMNGFSGHGLQQAPAVGRGIAELILFNRFVTLDLADLSVDRILEGRAFKEGHII